MTRTSCRLRSRRGIDQQRLPAGARRAVHPLQGVARGTAGDHHSVRFRHPLAGQRAWDRGVPGRRAADKRRRCGTDTTTPDPRAIAAGDVQDVRRSRSATAAGSVVPSMVRRLRSPAGTGRVSSYGGRKSWNTSRSPADRLAPRPAHLGEQPAEAGRPRHPPRELGGQHPRGPRIEVDLVAVTQGIAGDALVPGLRGDHRVAALHGEPSRELKARVRAAHARGSQVIERRGEGRHLPHGRGVGGVAPGRQHLPMTDEPRDEEPAQDGGRHRPCRAPGHPPVHARDESRRRTTRSPAARRRTGSGPRRPRSGG